MKFYKICIMLSSYHTLITVHPYGTVVELCLKKKFKNYKIVQQELRQVPITQGRRKLKKVGGGAPISRGTFGMNRAPKKFSPEMLATGWGEVGKKNKCNHKSKAIEADPRMRIKAVCRVPAQFLVLNGPIRRQKMSAKQAGHFALFNCLTFK